MEGGREGEQIMSVTGWKLNNAHVYKCDSPMQSGWKLYYVHVYKCDSPTHIWLEAVLCACV